MNLLHHYLILGYGMTGQSIVNYLYRQGWQCTVYDDQSTHFTKHPPPSQSIQCVDRIADLKPLSEYHQIFVSPGIADEHPLLQTMTELNIQGISDIEFFLRYATGKMIGITGSNGKSTVTRWLEYVLTQNAKKAIAVGNIGEPVLNYLDNPQAHLTDLSTIDYWIMELSSFQIQLTPSLKVDMATVINISADHIDRHHSLEQYTNVKQTLLEASNFCLLNRDAKNSYQPINPQKHHPIPWADSPSYGLSVPMREQDYGIKNNTLMRGETPLIEINQLPLAGNHNTLNALIVWMFAEQCGLNDQQIKSTITSWKGLEHRFQIIKQHHGITWINDSKSTNVGSMEVALKSCMELSQTEAKNILLIVGGQGKQADFTPLIPLLQKQVKAILLFGEDARIIAKAWDNQSLLLNLFETLDEVVQYCDENAQVNDCVLFSPGCASFDQFKNFQERGQKFMQLVHDKF